MTQAPQAEFSLENYRITKFSFSTPLDDDQNLDLHFNPSGVYSKGDSKFILSFDFKAIGSEDGAEITNATMLASFQFKENTVFESIVDYFYPNSIAIVFPFMRAFVAVMTMQANTKQLILPIINLTVLGAELKKNTEVID